MEFLTIAIGVGLVAVSPFVPGLRPVAKALVAGSLAVAASTKTAVSTVGEQWADVVAEAKAERSVEEEAKAAVAETITIPMPEKKQ
jgi:hypothetical protein